MTRQAQPAPPVRHPQQVLVPCCPVRVVTADALDPPIGQRHLHPIPQTRLTRKTGTARVVSHANGVVAHGESQSVTSQADRTPDLADDQCMMRHRHRGGNRPVVADSGITCCPHRGSRYAYDKKGNEEAVRSATATAPQPPPGRARDDTWRTPDPHGPCRRQIPTAAVAPDCTASRSVRRRTEQARSVPAYRFVPSPPRPVFDASPTSSVIERFPPRSPAGRYDMLSLPLPPVARPP